MDDIEIIEDVKPIKKGNKKIIIIILAVIIALLAAFCVYYFIINKKNNDTPSPVVEENKDVISQEVKYELLKIIDLTEDGHKKLSEEQMKNLGLESNKYINLSSNDLLSTFINFSVDKDVIINELNDKDKKEIIFKYANTYDMLTVEDCSFYMDIELANKLIGLYGIDKVLFEANDLKDNKLNYNLSCSQNMNVKKVEDSLTFERVNNTIVVNYKIKLDDDINKTIKYTFNQKDDESYYLYKVNVKND